MDEPKLVDPIEAFKALQEFHGVEMARLAGDIAAKNTFITVLQQEIQALKLELNQTPLKVVDDATNK